MKIANFQVKKAPTLGEQHRVSGLERDKEGDRVRPAADYSVIRMKDVGKKDF